MDQMHLYTHCGNKVKKIYKENAEINSYKCVKFQPENFELHVMFGFFLFKCIVLFSLFYIFCSLFLHCLKNHDYTLKKNVH